MEGKRLYRCMSDEFSAIRKDQVVTVDNGKVFDHDGDTIEVDVEYITTNPSEFMLVPEKDKPAKPALKPESKPKTVLLVTGFTQFDSIEELKLALRNDPKYEVGVYKVAVPLCELNVEKSISEVKE